MHGGGVQPQGLSWHYAVTVSQRPGGGGAGDGAEELRHLVSVHMEACREKSQQGSLQVHSSCGGHWFPLW